MEAAQNLTSVNVPTTDVPAPVVSFSPRKKRKREALVVLLPVVAAGVAWGLHRILPNRQIVALQDYYPRAMEILLLVAVVVAGLQAFFAKLRPWARHNAPLVAAAILVLAAFDLASLKFNLMPMVYFPGPDKILYAMVDDWWVLLRHLMYSLGLLLSGYGVGLSVGLVCGVMIGWSPRIRYWGMPLLKFVGPIPATAWIPLAMVLFPTAFYSRTALIAMAVWFPVTMLTASGISNVRVSYLDVARTLGAGRWFLIFRVAIPAALPSIFLGLFMGLGASFLTLIAAESVGSKQGLGFYISWAKESYEYPKVYAALILMAVFFSLIMTVLFKLRDALLVWQKGVIKW